jgi:glycosyltransferase involved in cell wall biosynthesis
MGNAPIVTLGFCVKDVEDTVKDAIDSILNQDFPHELMELIVVEGCSSDRTLSIVKQKLSNSDIDYRIFCERSGLGTARQMIVDRASGKYIVWVDGDMVLSRSFVGDQVAFMENNPSVAIAGGRYGLHMGKGIVPDLENVVYAVDSVYGKKKASKFGYLQGTEGAIYRVVAVRDCGGFDTQIKGAAEDTELTYRLMSRGWGVKVAAGIFIESTRKSVRSLWNQYFWYGYGGHFIFHKDTNMLDLWKMTPMVGFVSGLIRCSDAYKLTHQAKVFLLPSHYTFKRLAWLSGFIKGHFDGYGHSVHGYAHQERTAG